MLPWTVVYTARSVLAALQTSYRRRHHAAAVTPHDPQSRESRMWLVNAEMCYVNSLIMLIGQTYNGHLK